METSIVIWLILIAVLLAIPFAKEALRPGMRPELQKAAPGSLAKLAMGDTYYQWHGRARGPVVVCVHGLTTPSFVWNGLVVSLTKMGFRVLTYDLYGRGFSARPSGSQTREFFNRQLLELLENQGVKDDITLIGYSMGGAIASAFAAKHHNMLRRLVLIAPAGVGRELGGIARFIIQAPVIGDWLMLSLFPQNFRKGAEKERDLPTSVPGIVDQQIQQLEWRGFVPAVLSSMRGVIGKKQDEDHRVLAQTSLPVLAIWGEDDEDVPIFSLGQLSSLNRRVHQVSIPGAGHGLPYTHTNEVAQAISTEIAMER